MTKKSMLVILVIVAVIAVALGAQPWAGDGNDGPGAYQTDRDTVMDQAPTEPPSPPMPPGGRTGDEP